MSMLKRGADGWRGIIGERFSIPAAVRLSQGIAQFLTEKKGEGTLLISHDARLQSKATADAIIKSLVETGYHVAYGGMQSTPATSQALAQENCIGAILITASHNPFYWNGIKVKISPGMPPTRDDEERIEKILANGEHLVRQKKGTTHSIERKTIYEGYANRILKILSPDQLEEIRKRKFKVIVDALHGVSADAFSAFFHLLGCELTVLGSETDPLFFGMLPDPMNPSSRKRIVARMQNEHFDFGFVSDGDGDRLCVLDEKGNFVWPHDILGLLFEELVESRHEKGGMAVTGPTGSITQRICKRLQRKHFKTPVGFKHVSPYLQSKEAAIAGGAVGETGYSFSKNIDRDPLTSALLLLHICLKNQRSISKMVNSLQVRYGHSEYKQWTVSSMPKAEFDLREFGIRMVEDLGYKVREILDFDGYQFIIDDTAWILVRLATTEGGMRIYAEMHDAKELERVFAFISNATHSIPEEKA